MPHKLERLVRECVDHSHRMLLWARKPAAENRGFNKIHPHFELIAIQDLLSDTKPLFPQFESALAQLSEAGSGVESFYGITGTSYHQTGLTLAQTILEEVAEATGSILFDEPCIDGRGQVYVAGLGGFDLERTDLRDRLLTIELSDRARLQALVEKESLSLPNYESEVSPGANEPEEIKSKRRGRPPDTDPKADARIAQAWSTGRYKEYKDLERELKLKRGEVKRAIDRNRKRDEGRKNDHSE